jgi:phage tail sheath protein FI
MNTIVPKTFPGVYTSITDDSFVTPPTSLFLPGLVGVASMGPFNTPTVVRSLADFESRFGSPISTTYTPGSVGSPSSPVGSGFFLADAVDTIASLTDGITVVRIGNQYTTLSPSDVSGFPSTYTLYSAANAPRINGFMSPQGGGNNVYVSVTEPGQPSLVNALVVAAGNGTISIAPTVAIPGTYSSATLGYSFGENAAFSAESVIYCYTYGSNSSQTTDLAYGTPSTVSGFKNQFQFVCSANANAIYTGDVLKIMQTGYATTHEARVNSVLLNYSGTVATSGTVYLETSSIPQIGYQALPLQDNYTAATLYKATGEQPFLYLQAASPGTWANGQSSAQGLYLQVSPGSGAGTKKLQVFVNSALVETYDNIVDDQSTSNPNSWLNRLAPGISKYVVAVQANTLGLSANPTAANTVSPWDVNFYGSNAVSGLPAPMPVGLINAGFMVTTAYPNGENTGGQFNNGFNGENPTDSDWIGALDPDSDTLSGIRALEDTSTVDVNVIAAPQDNITPAVLQQLAASANKINAIAVADVPTGYNARQAIDWHNGDAPGQSGYRVSSPNLAVYWNWWTRTNSWGETKFVPPTLMVLERMAYTFNVDYPWTAAAGMTNGYAPDALSVQYNRISDDTKQAMYGNGNSVNPILNINNSFYVWGDRTMQVADSKLSAVHNVILVNWVVNGMAAIAQNFVFAPDDANLLAALNLAFTDFLDRIVNDEGMEAYTLTCNSSNNNATTRNNRQAIVNLALVPTDVAETIYINAAVMSSGAIVNSIT